MRPDRLNRLIIQVPFLRLSFTRLLIRKPKQSFEISKPPRPMQAQKPPKTVRDSRIKTMGRILFPQIRFEDQIRNTRQISSGNRRRFEIKIGTASCREKVEKSVRVGAL